MDTSTSQETAKAVTDYSLWTYLWVIALSSWGGVVSWVSKVRRGEVSPMSFLELIAEVVVAGFVGILTFWVCETAQIAPLLTAAMVGVSSHMGTRALFQFEKLFFSRLNKGA
jgi:CHASE2 domain-containing sensor protein